MTATVARPSGRGGPSPAHEPSRVGPQAAPRRVTLVALVLVGVLGLTAAAALMLGAPPLTPGEVLSALTDPEAPPLARLGVTAIRAPRLVLALVGGASLAVAGALLQTALRNPLAGPELLGVSAAAALTTAWVSIFTVVALALRPLVAALGGVVGGVLVLGLARRTRDPVRVILLGACTAALCNAMVVVLLALGTANDIGLFQRFVLGSLTNRTWVHVAGIAPWVGAGLVVAVLLRRPLDVLRLGDDIAAGVGVRVAQVRWMALGAAAILTAAVVSVCGQIGFVALLAPHLVRRLAATSDDRVVLPLAALAGAALLAVADLGARELFAPREVPVGALTAIVGGPTLLAVLSRLRRLAW